MKYTYIHVMVATSRCEDLQSTNCMPTYANLHISHPTYLVIKKKKRKKKDGPAAGQGRAEIGQMQVVISGRYRLQYPEF